MTAPGPAASDVLAALRREEHSRLLATLASRFGDLDLAEDAAQDALEAAIEAWPRTGVPDSPLAWLTTTATRKAIDRLRREKALTERLARLRVEEDRRTSAPPVRAVVEPDEIPDDRLELFFACCHPTLRTDEQVALILRYLGGLTTTEIAHAFLLPVTTVQQRLVRAKKRLRVTRIPIRTPGPDDLPARLPAVLAVIYLIFTEGYAASTGDGHLRGDLTTEAIRLARIVHRLVPGQPEATGLLALLLLTEARAPARVDDEGLPVPLREQDRDRWDRLLSDEGLGLAMEAAAGGPGPYSVQASIAAVHAESRDVESTDWAQIVVLYDLLLALAPGPVVRMARAVAVGRRDGPQSGLRQLDALAGEAELERHHPFHAARATTLEELGRGEEARRAWARAHQLTENASEREYLVRRWWNA